MDKYFETRTPEAKDRYGARDGEFWYPRSWATNMQSKSADPLRNSRVGNNEVPRMMVLLQNSIHQLPSG
jgi:hypothetical protein